MTKPINPCGVNCPGRSATCRIDGSCNKYSEFATLQEEYRNQRHVQKAGESLIREVKIDRVNASRKRSRAR